MVMGLAGQSAAWAWAWLPGGDGREGGQGGDQGRNGFMLGTLS